jgi:hypothetical protein
VRMHSQRSDIIQIGLTKAKLGYHPIELDPVSVAMARLWLRAMTDTAIRLSLCTSGARELLAKV